MTGRQADSGVYLLILDLPRRLSVVVGCLGRVSVDPGRYAYVGSARRGLSSRLNRHRRRRKPSRWHIDRLTRVADVVAAIVWPWDPGRECALARALQETGLGQVVVRRFGASDCRCGGHLLTLADADLRAVADRLSPLLDAKATRVLRLVQTQRAPRQRAAPPRIRAAV